MKQGMSKAVIRHEQRNLYTIPNFILDEIVNVIKGRYGKQKVLEAEQGLKEHLHFLCEKLNDANENANYIRAAIRQAEDALRQKK